MKVRTEADRIRLQAEYSSENDAINVILDMLAKANVPDQIFNDHGCERGSLNYCCIPLLSLSGIASL